MNEGTGTPPLPHAVGEPCPVVGLLIGHFGEQVGEYLLWEFTCFPFDDVTAYKQAANLVAHDTGGTLNTFLQSELDYQDNAMREAAERAA